jgi:hypothetical protein
LTIEQIMNWNDIAEQCGTTSGAASKRYSRMKQAFEAGNAPPGSNPASPAPKTVEEEKDEDEKLGFKSKFEDSRNEDMHPSKKAKVAKPRATPDSKVTVKKETSMSVPTSNAIIFTKGEVEDNIEDTIEGRDGFVDPKEWVNELAGSSTIADDEDQDNRELSTRFL